MLRSLGVCLADIMMRLPRSCIASTAFDSLRHLRPSTMVLVFLFRNSYAYCSDFFPGIVGRIDFVLSVTTLTIVRTIESYGTKPLLKTTPQHCTTSCLMQYFCNKTLYISCIQISPSTGNTILLFILLIVLMCFQTFFAC